MRCCTVFSGIARISAAFVGAIAIPAAAWAATSTASSLHVDAESEAAAVVAQLTLDEKVAQLLNVAPPIPRLGVPGYNWWTESLHGAIGTVPTTNFPEPIGLAASFDEAMLGDVAAAIRDEIQKLHGLARQTGRRGRIGTGLDTWSPNINIFRDPRWGRGQETYGEDPYLTARLGVAYVRGIQGENVDAPAVVASPKHFAVHSGPESTRHSANVFVSAHDLEDTYLPAFRAAIVDGKAGSIMCAYNRVNGQPACASDLLLKEKLRGAWGFKGYVVSDCDAVRDISDNHKYAPDPVIAVAVALKAGVDNECNTATLFDVENLDARYKEALQRGLISTADVDQALVRLFAARYRTGDLPVAGRNAGSSTASTVVTTQAHSDLALLSAEKSLVLLKNDGILPFKRGIRIAVVGPHGDSTRMLRGNYSSPLTGAQVSVEDGLRQAMPDAQVKRIPFSPSITDGDPVPASALLTPDGKPGLRTQYFNVSKPWPTTFASPEALFQAAAKMTYVAKPTLTRIEPDIAARGNEFAQLSDHHRVIWTGFLVPPASGVYRIGLSGIAGKLTLDGKLISELRPFSFSGSPKFTAMTLEQGRRYPIEVVAESHVLTGIDLLWKRVSTADTALADAVTDSDVIVAVVGLTSDLEGEEMKVELEGFQGGDKTSLDLPADQRELLWQAKASGKPVVVVAMNGSPIDLSWAKQHAAAIVEAWYPGQSGGLAIGRLLSGKFNPAGRLPLTFYHSVSELPPFGDYSMQGRTYRYFQGTPVYPFGYGLSYSRFEYGPLSVEPLDGSIENGLRITTQLTNRSTRDGEEVTQVYLDPPDFPGAPRLALRGFRRVPVPAGESRTLEFQLTPRDLSFVDADGKRQLMPGSYVLSAGSGQPGSGVPVQTASFTVSTAVAIPE